MIHSTRGTILVKFLWPFYYALLMLRGKMKSSARINKNQGLLLLRLLYMYTKRGNTVV